ncbi:MAG: hypothetical protein LW629_06085 [Burkholderiales bacterium]|jgi:hypothetical protein|nr:hypothetical protein [Burkholderiales bacterium]
MKAWGHNLRDGLLNLILSDYSDILATGAGKHQPFLPTNAHFDSAKGWKASSAGMT